MNSLPTGFVLRFLSVFLLACPVLADDVAQHSGAWFMYFGDHPWSDRWGLHLDAQLRRVDFLAKGQQLQVRPGVNFLLNPHVTFMVGYANIQNYSFDSISYRERVNEHRIHEEVTISHPFLRATLRHRVRVEQRFADYSGDWQYRNRVRYRLSANIPFSKYNSVALYHEFFSNFGSRTQRAFDQNRAYGAIGHDFGKVGRLEVGYLFQRQQIADTRFRHVNALQVAYYSKVPLRKRR